jgi:CRISPR/Cas system endoribonuclease Cas6 (RAMP superfamily)
MHVIPFSGSGILVKNYEDADYPDLLHLSFPDQTHNILKHKYDKHPLSLSYLPIENHKNEYFCEICKEVLNPHESFYHCHKFYI